MQLLHWKVRLSLLWVVFAVGMSAQMLLAISEPGTVEELMRGRIEGTEVTTGLLVFGAVFWVVPLLMAFLSLVLRDRVNRYVNAGTGFVITLMWAWELVPSVSEGFIGIAIVVAAMVAAGVAILWHAWRWPSGLDEQELTEDVTPVSAGIT